MDFTREDDLALGAERDIGVVQLRAEAPAPHPHGDAVAVAETRGARRVCHRCGALAACGKLAAVRQQTAHRQRVVARDGGKVQTDVLTVEQHFGKAAAEAVASGECDKGIVICTTGIGISITANKVKGIRCALCGDPLSAEMTRRHNDANMLAMGAGIVGPNLAERIVEVFLNTAFEGGRHARRVGLITEMEK